MKLIVSSELDKAGENIRENLLEKYPFEQLKNDYFYDTNKEILLVRIKNETIYMDFPEKIIQEENK